MEVLRSVVVLVPLLELKWKLRLFKTRGEIPLLFSATGQKFPFRSAAQYWATEEKEDLDSVLSSNQEVHPTSPKKLTLP